jgi:hypothetical protein
LLGRGKAVVLPGKYLRRFELRGRGVLWKSLWNCWLRKKYLAVKICQRFGCGRFSVAKTLSSNQLGNSLGINIVRVRENRDFSHFGVLHIPQLLTF